ncbi:MAG: EF-P 5-aminopentanol modification-associated protein YfmH [Oscillospiraceae bacterium]
MKHKNYSKIGENLYTAELHNGLRINVVTKPGFRLSYAVFATNYGGAHRRFFLNGRWHDTPAGVAHFLEHKMFDMPDGDNALSVLSANGAQPNAFTSSGMTAYYFDCTSGFEENLRMLLKFVSTPYFTDETVQKEQGIIGQEICMVEDNPGYVVYNRLMRMLYEHNPIRDQVAGSIESIAQISADTLYNCHKAFYSPSNMTLCVASDFSPEKIVEIAGEILPAERAEVPEADMGTKESDKPVRTFNEEKMEVSAPQFLIGAKVSPAPGGDELLRQKIVAQLALRVLFGTSGSFYNRLYSEGLLNRDYDYEIDYTAGTATIILGGESADPRRVLNEINQAIDSVKANGLDKAAFEAAKRASFGSRLRGLEDFDSLCLALADGVFGGYCFLDCFDVLESVSIEECEAFLTEFMAPDRLAMSVISPVK